MKRKVIAVCLFLLLFVSINSYAEDTFSVGNKLTSDEVSYRSYLDDYLSLKCIVQDGNILPSETPNSSGWSESHNGSELIATNSTNTSNTSVRYSNVLRGSDNNKYDVILKFTNIERYNGQNPLQIKINPYTSLDFNGNIALRFNCNTIGIRSWDFVIKAVKNGTNDSNDIIPYYYMNYVSSANYFQHEYIKLNQEIDYYTLPNCDFSNLNGYSRCGTQGRNERIVFKAYSNELNLSFLKINNKTGVWTDKYTDAEGSATVSYAFTTGIASPKRVKMPIITYKTDNNGAIIGEETDVFELDYDNYFLKSQIPNPTGRELTPNEHYEFSYWTCDNPFYLGDKLINDYQNYKISSNELKKINVYEDLTFTAHFDKMHYVTYVASEGGVITGITEEYVTNANNPSNTSFLVDENYYISSITANKDVSTLYETYKKGEDIPLIEVSNIVITDDIEFTYNFAKKIHVRYVASDGGVITGITEDYLIPSIPIKETTYIANENYHFDLYSSDKELYDENNNIFSSENNKIDLKINKLYAKEDIVITLHFKLNPKVIYSVISGEITGIRSEYVEINKSPKGTTCKPNENYHFIGWKCDKNITLKNGNNIKVGELVSQEQILEIVVIEDIILTANNDLNPLITYQSDIGGVVSGINSEHVEINNSPKGTSIETNEGYIFVKWIANCDVLLKNGEVIPFGEELTNIEDIVVSKDLIIKAVHRKVPELKLSISQDKENYHYLDRINYEVSLLQEIEDTYSSNVSLINTMNTAGVDLIGDSVVSNLGNINLTEEGFNVDIDKLDYKKEVNVSFSCIVNTNSFNAQDIYDSVSVSCVENKKVVLAETTALVYYKVDTEVVNGFITEGSDSLKNGDNFKVLFKPKGDNYFLKNLYIDNVMVDNVGANEREYTFTDIKSDHLIRAEFEEKESDISAVAKSVISNIPQTGFIISITLVVGVALLIVLLIIMFRVLKKDNKDEKES